ncbi:TPA: hypothetical protein MM168_005258 [Klebsiella variicola subsp. variicola]|nr:hypothetical protein [Klebsiella variicola subsp. variicola]
MLFSNIRQRLANANARLANARRNSLNGRTELFEKMLGSHVSRRDALRFSVTATFATPIFGSLARAASRFSIQAHPPHNVAILVVNEVLFEVRARDFGPDAQVDFQQTTPNEFIIRLHNGWFPGTHLAADFKLHVARGNTGWHAQLTWPALVYETHFDFEPWLMGFSVATGPLDAARLLASLGLETRNTALASAIFLPNWTFEISLSPPVQILLAPGTVAATQLQLELVSADEPMLLVKDSALRTRLWLKGSLLDTTAIHLFQCQVAFTKCETEAVVEYCPETPMTWAMESIDSFQDTGIIIPHAPANKQMEGFATHQLRLVKLEDGQLQAHATLTTQARWYEAPGIHIEVSTVNTIFQASSHSDLAHAGAFHVTRMVVGLPNVDKSIFIRIPRQKKAVSEVDNLAWFNGLHLFGRSVPLDDFELHLARGSDALQVIVRFHDVRLKVTDTYKQLLCGSQARLEFAFASQHVSEQALYITQLNTHDSQDGRLIHDDQICQLLIPQEQSCDQSETGQTPTPSTAARFADVSWLTFDFSPNENKRERRLPFTLQSLFSWATTGANPQEIGLQPVLHPLFALPADASLEVQSKSQRNKKNDGPPKSLREAVNGQLEIFATMIQAPYRLGLSPIGKHHWQAPPLMQEAPGGKELWTLRLEKSALRAIWSPDYNPNFWPKNYPHIPKPKGSFRASLDARDRHEIVALSSGFGEKATLGSAQVVPISTDTQKGQFVPRPIHAQLLQLSAYGASLRLKANWAPPSTDDSALTISFWSQNCQLGRDTLCIVEYKGFLFPLGIPATLVKNTQRRLVFIDGKFFARLVQRFYIKMPALRRATPMLLQPFEGRGWPFGSITCNDYSSPDLVLPEQCGLEGLTDVKPDQQVFWPSVLDNQVTVPVDFAFEDPITGVKARSPLLFIDNGVAHDHVELAKVAQAYRKGVNNIYTSVDALRFVRSTNIPRRFIARIDSGAIRFAPETNTGSTRFKVSCLLLDFDVPGSPPKESTFNEASLTSDDTLEDVLKFTPSMEAQDQPPFYPHLRQALATAGSVMRLSGSAAVESLVEIDGPYLRHGFDANNVGEIYLRFVDDKTRLTFSSNTINSGGFANASTIVAAVSRKNGPIGGSGKLLPQVEFYRNESQTIYESTGNNLIADPVANARKGTADPREFFGQTLGEAKLCGVVAFADIIDSVTQATGDYAPQIREALEYAVTRDALTPIAATLHDALARLIEALNRLSVEGFPAPALLEAAQTLDRKLFEVPDAKADRLVRLTSEIVNAGERLRDCVNTAVESPANLISSEVLKNIEALKTLGDKWQTFLNDDLVQQVKKRLLDSLNVAQAIHSLDILKSTLVVTLKTDPRYKVLAAQVEQLRTAFTTIEQATQLAPQAFLAALFERLQPLFNGLNDYAGWSNWLNVNHQGVQGTLTKIAINICSDSTHYSDLVNQAEALKSKADSFKKSATIDQTILQVSEISLAAIAYCESVQSMRQRYQRESSATVQLQILVELFTGALRFSQEAISKIMRLQALKDHFNIKSFEESYLGWVRAVFNYSQLPTVLEEIGELSRSVTSITQWVSDIEAFLKELNSATPFETLTTQARAVGSFGQLNELITAALLPNEDVQVALGKFQHLTEQPLTDALSPVCTSLQKIIDSVGLLTKDSHIQDWLSPALVRQITDLNCQLQHFPDPKKCAWAYLARFDKTRIEMTTLVESVSRMFLSANLSALIDIKGELDDALALIGLPTKARLNYDWDTRVTPYPAGGNPIFEPKREGRLTIRSLLEADLRNTMPPVFNVSASLDPFSINLFGAVPFLSILFNTMSFSARSGRETRLDVSIDHVEFRGALTFVKTLQTYLNQTFGMSVEPRKGGPGLVVGYSFSKNLIPLTAFQLQMVSFNISCEMPFDNEPARFRFSLSRPDQPFMISTGIYGGGGHVAIQSRADTLEVLDASFEYGVVTAFQFGPAVGRGRITAGIYIRLSVREATLSGYFNASGIANIAGLVTVSAQFRVQLWYDLKSGRTAGMATFCISFSIGFFNYEYDVTVSYASQGESQEGAGKNAQAKESLLPPPTSAAPTDKEELAALKNKIARDIKPSSFENDSNCLLDPMVWQAYWAAFEDFSNECI